MNFLTINLKNEPLIVGSFLIHSIFLKEHFISSDVELEQLIISELAYPEPKDYFESDCEDYYDAEEFEFDMRQEDKFLQRMKSYGKDSGFIVFHILKNENQPCIIIQAYDDREAITCLFNFFMELRNDPIKFISFVASIVVRNSNVFYRSELIENLSINEKNQLIKLHNKKQISFSNKLINKISQQFKFKNEEVILYLKGKSYKHIRILEEKASVKILSINLISDSYNDYLSLHYLLGNDDYHNDKICICNEWGVNSRG